MKTFRLCGPLLLASLAFGGADIARAAAPVPAAAAPTPASTNATLMKAVFEKDYRPASADALAKMPMFEDRKKKAPYIVKPLTSSVLKSGDTVFVTQAERVNAQGEEIGGEIGQENLVSAYVLRDIAGKWTVLKRHENIVYRGLDKRPGSVLFPMLGKDKQGLAIIHGLTDEGCFVEKLHLFDLTQDIAHDLAEGIQNTSKDSEYCAGEETNPLSAITSKWHLAPSKKPGAYDDLVMLFSIDTTEGAKAAGGKRPPPNPTQKVTARYVYGGTKYKLAEGRNPLEYSGK